MEITDMSDQKLYSSVVIQNPIETQPDVYIDVVLAMPLTNFKDYLNVLTIASTRMNIDKSKVFFIIHRDKQNQLHMTIEGTKQEGDNND